jgi:hypothetical protein
MASYPSSTEIFGFRALTLLCRLLKRVLRATRAMFLASPVPVSED